METKQCCTCKEYKLATNEFFASYKRGKYGLNAKCKICDNNYKKQWIKIDKSKQIRKTSVKKANNRFGAGIYEITNLFTGKNYIGETFQLIRRRYEHYSIYNTNKISSPLLQEDMKLYSPDAFSFIILEQLPKNKKILQEREKYWINKLKPTYNIKIS